jgi:hypothetical protein
MIGMLKRARDRDSPQGRPFATRAGPFERRGVALGATDRQGTAGGTRHENGSEEHVRGVSAKERAMTSPYHQKSRQCLSGRKTQANDALYFSLESRGWHGQN